MLNRTILSILVVLSSSSSAITLDEFSQQLVENHPYFVQLSLSEKTSLINQKSLSTYTDWNIKAGVSETYTGGDEVASRLYDGLYSTKYDIGATRKVSHSGASVNLKHSLTRNDKDSNSTHSNLFSIDYVRPLLQNKDGLNDKLNLDLASIDLLAKKISLEEQAENFLASKLSKFVDLAVKQEVVKNHKIALNLSNEQLQLAEDKFKNSLIDITVLIQEKDNYVKARQQSLQSNKELIIERRELADLIGASESEMIVEMDLFKKQALSDVKPREFVKSSRAIQKFDFDKAKLQRELESLENKKMPNLNLNLGLSSLGENDKVFSSFGNRNYSWNVGVDISYPLGSRKELLAVENTEIKMSDTDAKKREAEIDSLQHINYLLAQVDLLTELVALYLEQGALAEEKVIEEQIKYSEARGQKSLVLAAKTSSNRANLTYLQAAGTYQKIIIDYKAAIDQLFN
ncbi:TolC family protein [Candidatus Pseudothioglobus singularis]|nr:TolC family protein [Candidatus Pseudothioglobus singularis]